MLIDDRRKPIAYHNGNIRMNTSPAEPTIIKFMLNISQDPLSQSWGDVSSILTPKETWTIQAATAVET